jgi:multidrug efflux pump subunit AcrA (membrane-fusion protein)
VQFLSSVAPIEEHQLFFRTDGRVRAIHVQESQNVRAGQLLAELEMTDLLNRVDQARVNLDKARMLLAEIESNRIAVAKAEAELASRQLERRRLANEDPEQGITVARASLDKAALALEAAQAADAAHGRTEPSLELRQAQLELTVAQANYDRAVRSRVDHQIRLQMLDQEIELARLKVEEIRTQRNPQAISDVRLAELELKQLEDLASMMRITAPISGRVMSVNLLAGGEVKAYTPVLVVADPSSFEIRADLLREEVLQLYVGQEAQIELVDQPGRVIPGVVRRLPYAGLTGSDYLESLDRSTRIRFNPPRDIPLEVGDLARATVVLDRRENVLYLPKEAVRSYQGRRFVVVEEPDRRRRVDVKIGLLGDDRMELEEGVKEGEIVVGQ